MTTSSLGCWLLLGAVVGCSSPSVPSPLADAGNDASAASHKVMFVTSATFTGDLGGLAGADAKCQNAAKAASLAGTFKAWISTHDIAAADRLTHATVPYVRVDGLKLAADWGALTSGPPLVQIDVTESGTPAAAGTTVWTDTFETGAINSIFPNANCNAWSSASASDDGSKGKPSDPSGQWSASEVDTCATNAALYCLEQ